MSQEVGGMVQSKRVKGAESAPTARRWGRAPPTTISAQQAARQWNSA